MTEKQATIFLRILFMFLKIFVRKNTPFVSSNDANEMDTIFAGLLEHI